MANKKASFDVENCEIGKTIEYTIFSDADPNIKIIGTRTVASATESFSDILLPGIADGTITVINKLTDATGNISRSSESTFVYPVPPDPLYSFEYAKTVEIDQTGSGMGWGMKFEFKTQGSNNFTALPSGATMYWRAGVFKPDGLTAQFNSNSNITWDGSVDLNGTDDSGDRPVGWYTMAHGADMGPGFIKIQLWVLDSNNDIIPSGNGGDLPAGIDYDGSNWKVISDHDGDSSWPTAEDGLGSDDKLWTSTGTSNFVTIDNWPAIGIIS